MLGIYIVELFEKIVREYGLSLYNTNVAIYAVNMNEALNAPRIIKYIYSQPIFLEIRRVDVNKVGFTLKNRFGREIIWIYHNEDYNGLKESTQYAIQQIKKYRYKLKLEDIRKEFI